MRVEWNNRKGCIVTMHGKQEAVAPLLFSELGIECSTLETVNTDALGTFSGEVERKGSPLEALRNKCQLAIDQGFDDIIIASEGSFGPHPQMYFAYADDEWVMLKDVKHDLEILGRHVSTHTNFNAREIGDWPTLVAFAEQAKFPSHALILRPAVDQWVCMKKGIMDWTMLKTAYASIQDSDGKVYVETDMRAQFNPSRMKVIKQATADLIKMANRLCPQCQTPGFSISQVIPGLPCEVCAMPTASTLKLIYQCAQCQCSSEQKYPNHKQRESPMFCTFCNP